MNVKSQGPNEVYNLRAKFLLKRSLERFYMYLGRELSTRTLKFIANLLPQVVLNIKYITYNTYNTEVGKNKTIDVVY